MISVKRGDDFTFKAGFWEDAAQTIPRPALTEDQPSYQVVDPDGTVAVSSVADPDPTKDGRYMAIWSVPETAELSRSSREWRIDWTFIDTAGHTVVFSEPFDVKPRDVTRDVEKDKGYLTWYGHGATIQNRRDTQPFSISVTVTLAADPNVVIQTVRQELDLDLEELGDGDSWVYRDQIAVDNLMNDASYTIMWEILETATSLPRYESEVLRCASKVWLTLMSQLDTSLNKVRAKATDLQSWTDYEKFDACLNGLRFVNAWHPNTVQWPIGRLPNELLGYVSLMAQWHALGALAIAEGELAFSFSGASSTFDYDHTGWVESALSRSIEYVNANLTRDKTAIVRRAMPVGVLAVRPVQLYGRNSQVFRVANGPMITSGTVQFMAGLGLLL